MKGCGMITEENRIMVGEFRKKYVENMEELKRWNDRLFDDVSEKEWIKLLLERSESIRAIYSENEELLKHFEKLLPEKNGPVDEETAFILAELVQNLFKNGIDDISLIVRLCRLSLSYFEGTGDYDKRIILNSVLGNELSIFYRLIKDHSEVSNALESYRRIQSLSDHFLELKDAGSRSALVYSYRNLLMFTGHFRYGKLSDCYRIFTESVAFLKSDPVTLAAEEDEQFGAVVSEALSEIYSTFISCIMSFYPDASDKSEILDKFVNGKYSEADFSDILDPGSSELLSVLTGAISETVWLDDNIKWLRDNAPVLDYSGEDIEAQMGSFLEFNSRSGMILEFLLTSDLPEDIKHSYASKIIPVMKKMFAEMPYTFLTEMMNSMIAEWFYVAEPFMETDSEKRTLLIDLLIRRQPVTYIHSLMVREIIQLIGEKIISTKPELLGGVCGFPDGPAVQEHAEEVLYFLSQCGLVHDVGKCIITDVINRQNRPLTDDEFSLIKYHPLLGAEMADISALAPYKDIIVGHHKSYDGKSGYPLQFDNTASSLRFVIDLVSIADSIDAATDVLGRNYTKGKDFDLLFSELRAGAGTRYNPDIVRIIEEDEKLYDSLSRLTTEGRFKVYREAYREILRRK